MAITHVPIYDNLPSRIGFIDVDYLRFRYKKDFYDDGKKSEIQSFRDFIKLAQTKRDEGKKVTVAIR